MNSTTSYSSTEGKRPRFFFFYFSTNVVKKNKIEKDNQLKKVFLCQELERDEKTKKQKRHLGCFVCKGVVGNWIYNPPKRYFEGLPKYFFERKVRTLNFGKGFHKNK
jgi:hypothetical protein